MGDRTEGNRSCELKLVASLFLGGSLQMKTSFTSFPVKWYMFVLLNNIVYEKKYVISDKSFDLL